MCFYYIATQFNNPDSSPLLNSFVYIHQYRTILLPLGNGFWCVSEVCVVFLLLLVASFTSDFLVRFPLHSDVILYRIWRYNVIFIKLFFNSHVSWCYFSFMPHPCIIRLKRKTHRSILILLVHTHIHFTVLIFFMTVGISTPSPGTRRLGCLYSIVLFATTKPVSLAKMYTLCYSLGTEMPKFNWFFSFSQTKVHKHVVEKQKWIGGHQ